MTVGSAVSCRFIAPGHRASGGDAFRRAGMAVVFHEPAKQGWRHPDPDDWLQDAGGRKLD